MKAIYNFDKRLRELLIYYLESIEATSWLHTLSYIRNVCAHYGRLYGKNLIIKPKLPKGKQKEFKNNRVFAAIFALTNLLHQDERKHFLITLQALIEKYSDYIKLKEIGFPSEWIKILGDI